MAFEGRIVYLSSYVCSSDLLFIGSMYATSVILVLATPVLAITLILVAAEHLFNIGVFDPKLGGDPLLFQHLLWFYSHPAVYIMILPAMGVVSELIKIGRATWWARV